VIGALSSNNSTSISPAEVLITTFGLAAKALKVRKLKNNEKMICIKILL
jgi:hypothetical protein